MKTTALTRRKPLGRTSGATHQELLDYFVKGVPCNIEDLRKATEEMLDKVTEEANEYQEAIGRLNSAMDEIANICENMEFDDQEAALAEVNKFIRWEET